MRTPLTFIAGLAMAIGGASFAQAFPDEPIVINSCQPAGGGNDRNLQTLVPFGKKYLGQNIIVQYRTGSGGTLAMQELKAAEPDGYTLVLCDQGGTILGPIAQNIDFDAADVVPIARVAFVPWILTVHSSTPYMKVEDLVDAAAKEPGQIKAAIADIASADHYMWLRFTKAAGLGPNGLRWIPYGGGAPKVRAMLAGESLLDMLFLSLIQGPVKEGIMRPLAVASTERLPELPDVPTFQEAGMDIVEGLSIGLFAPAGTPADRVEILRKGFMEMSKDPEFREVYGRLGQDINGFMAGDEYQADWDQSWAEARDLLGAVIAR